MNNELIIARIIDELINVDFYEMSTAEKKIADLLVREGKAEYRDDPETKETFLVSNLGSPANRIF